MKKIYTQRDIEELIANGGNFDSLPPKAMLTPLAQDIMREHLRKHGKPLPQKAPAHSAPSVKPSPIKTSSGKVNPRAPYNATPTVKGTVTPAYDPVLPDFEFNWAPGKDPSSPAEIEAFFNSPEIRVLKERICDIGRRMWSKNYVDGNGGNITVRVGDNLALSTPTLISKGFIAPEDICLVDLDGNQKAGWRKRTSEANTHFAIMKATPKAKSCVHAHPPYATAFAVASIEPPTCLIPEAEVFLGKIGIADYQTPGSPENAKAVGAMAKDHQAILMQNHGVICWGKDVEDAYWKMENTEAYLQTVWVACQLGVGLKDYGPGKLREIIGIRKSLGMDDYRESLEDCELCNNIAFAPGQPRSGHSGDAPDDTCHTCTLPNNDKNADAEAAIRQITEMVIKQMGG